MIDFARTTPVRRVVGLVLGAGIGFTLGGLVMTSPLTGTGASEADVHYIQADFAYDVSDPELVAGDAAVVAVATVEDLVRVDGDRTVFRVRVQELLEGLSPPVVLVSQLGSATAENGVQQLEDFPLMAEGNTYIVALVAPSVHEPEDALIVLSATGDGNLVQVAGVDDPAVSGYREAVAQQQSPWLEEDGAEEARAQDYARWLERHDLP